MNTPKRRWDFVMPGWLWTLIAILVILLILYLVGIRVDVN